MQNRIRGQADDIIERSHSNIVIVLRRGQGLLGIGQIYLRGQHVRLGYRAYTVLSINVIQMFLISLDRIFLNLDKVLVVQHVVIALGSAVTDALLGIFQGNIRGVQAVTCGFDTAAQGEIIQGNGSRSTVRIVVVIYMRLRGSIISPIVSRSQPQRHTSLTAVLGQIPFSHIHVS